jgi:parallel beta-helix repeat protein
MRELATKRLTLAGCIGLAAVSIRPDCISRFNSIPVRIRFLLILGLIPSVSSSAEIKVDKMEELIKAIRAAEPGDTILLRPGRYRLETAPTIQITGKQEPIVVRGETGNPADVILEGLGQDRSKVHTVFTLDDSPRWTFQDFTTQDTYFHGIKLDHASTDVVMRNLIMRDHGSAAIKGTSDPRANTYPDRLLVEKCDIGYTDVAGGMRSVVEGIDGVGVEGWIIRSCRFVNIQRGGSDAYGVFTKGNSSNTIIEGCIFENCFIGASFGGGGSDEKYFREKDTTWEHRFGIIRNNLIIRSTDAGIYVNKAYGCKIYNNTWTRSSGRAQICGRQRISGTQLERGRMDDQRSALARGWGFCCPKLRVTKCPETKR